jgi:hemolysin D
LDFWRRRAPTLDSPLRSESEPLAANRQIARMPAAGQGRAMSRVPPRPPTAAELAQRAADREFLPAALSIVETPPSPRRLHVIAAIAALLGCTLALSYFGYISDYTAAAGRIQAVGRTKVIEPREAGEVKAIRAADGDRVKEGDVLIELDPTIAAASRAIVADQLTSLRAQMARAQTELKAARAATIDPNASIAWPDAIPARIREREEGVLRADLSSLAATLADLGEQRKAAEVSRDKYSTNIAAQNALLDVTTEHVAMNESLEKEGWNSRNKVLEITEKLRQQQTAMSTLQGGLAKAQAAIPVIDSQIAKAREVFVTNATQFLATTDRQADDLTQQLAKADQILSDMTLKSPLAGVVHASAVTTVGQMALPGQQLMQIVPEGVPLEVVGYLANADMGFVKVGQKVEIKVDTFPYATYGTIPGTVTNIGKDALPADTKKNVLQTVALDGNVAQTTAAQKTGNIVFPVTVQASRSTMNIDGKTIALTSGMAVTIDIKTEDRRAIDYIASPLIELFSTAAHEQ